MTTSKRAFARATAKSVPAKSRRRQSRRNTHDQAADSEVARAIEAAKLALRQSEDPLVQAAWADHAAAIRRAASGLPGRVAAFGPVRERNIALAVAAAALRLGGNRGDQAAAMRQVSEKTGYRYLSVKAWYIRHRQYATTEAARQQAIVRYWDRVRQIEVDDFASIAALLELLPGELVEGLIKRASPLQLLQFAKEAKNASPSGLRDIEERIRAFISTKGPTPTS